MSTVAPARAWATVVATARGASHERDGSPGQDVAGVAPDRAGTVVAAVADGAGSAREGGNGAALAVRAALDAAAAALEQGAEPSEAASTALDAARTALEDAVAGDVGLADLATTLVVAVAGPDSTGVAVVGDSVCVVDSDAGTEVITGESGEYVNETTFVTSTGWNQARRDVEVPGPANAVALFSDGLSPLALSGALSAHQPFFDPLFAFVRANGSTAEDDLATFLRSDRVRSRTDDDVSLVLIARTVDA